MKYIFQFRRSFLLYYFLFKLEKNCNIYRFKRNGRVGFFLFSQERKTDEKNNGYVVFILKYPVPEFIDPVFTKTSPKRSFSVIQNERFGLVFEKTGSIISGTGDRMFWKFPHTILCTAKRCISGILQFICHPSTHQNDLHNG